MTLQKKWYVVNTQANQETTVEHHLQRQGFTVFLPSFIKTRRHARRIDKVRKPLFPGYLFVEEPGPGLPFNKINGTYGVRNLIMQGPSPAHVQEELVQELQMRCDTSGVMEDPDLQVGKKVRFKSGPLVNLVAVLHTLNDQERLTVLFDFLGKKVRKTVYRSDVVPA